MANSSAPVAASNAEQTAPRPQGRRHDLDALRSFAMLLGVSLHASIAFVPYQSGRTTGVGFADGFFGFVHGFRMPIFFILSGYFTTMLWQRRGTFGLVQHRVRRIAVPLVLGTVTIVPLVRLAMAKAPAISGTGAPPQWEAFGFSHLWFLWFLTLMIVGFVVVTGSASWLLSKAPQLVAPTALCSRLALLALPLLTAVPASRMVDGVFGADYSDSLVPNDGVLAYYACFYVFGALLFGRTGRRGEHHLIDTLGRRWGLQVAVSTLVLFPLGNALMADNVVASQIVQVAYAWLMSFGLLGLFRSFLSAPNRTISWLSDSSYWTYLVHMPVVVALQAVASRLGLSPAIGMPFVFVATTATMLLSYQYLVRYTPVGIMLNGARVRPPAHHQHRLSEASMDRLHRGTPASAVPDRRQFAR